MLKLTFALSPATTPLNTTLFELIVAVVLPSYTLLFALKPEVIVTVATVLLFTPVIEVTVAVCAAPSYVTLYGATATVLGLPMVSLMVVAPMSSSWPRP